MMSSEYWRVTYICPLQLPNLAAFAISFPQHRSNDVNILIEGMFDGALVPECYQCLQSLQATKAWLRGGGERAHNLHVGLWPQHIVLVQCPGENHVGVGAHIGTAAGFSIVAILSWSVSSISKV